MNIAALQSLSFRDFLVKIKKMQHENNILKCKVRVYLPILWQDFRTQGDELKQIQYSKIPIGAK